MDLFRHLFGLNQKDPPELLSAIERAVSLVEPQLKHSSQYPKAFRKPVRTALEYAHNLAYSVPGPIAVNLDSYAHDAYVHAIFPSMDHVSDAFRASHAIQDYLRENPATDEIYALMGMRRREKATMGIELSGEVIQRDVPQNVVYFISHTVVDPAPSEKQSRERVAWGFFNDLVRKVTDGAAQTGIAIPTARDGFADGPFACGRCAIAPCFAKRTIQNAVQSARSYPVT